MRWRKYVKRLLIVLPILLIVLYFGVVPMRNKEIYLPGGINAITDVVEIEGEKAAKGGFYSSYVTTIPKPSRLVHWFALTFLDGESVELSKSSEEASIFEMNAYSRETKKHSVLRSIIVAYTLADQVIEYDLNGVTIAFRDPSFPIYNSKIRVGYRIIGVNGSPVSSRQELSEILRDLSSCKDIQLDVIDLDGNLKTMTVAGKASNPGCTLGIIALDYYEIDFQSTDPKIVSINDKGYGGSAGLLQTLMIYNKLVEEDITRGLKISGTGGIDIEGNVTAISGIRQKVLGAIKGKVDVFFAPDLETNEGNLYEIAVQVRDEKKSDMVIVPVRHIQDAIDYLRSLP